MRFLRGFPSHRGLIFALATMLVFLTVGHNWLKDLHNPFTALLFLLWLLPAIVGAAFSVVRHADALAHRLGEPYGTLVLTLSVTAMEVTMISAVMLTGPDNPTLARDTMFSVVMMILGGLVGTSLLIGGLRHRQQEFNLEGANSYLALIVPISLFGLVLPNFTVTTTAPTYSPAQSIIVAVLCVAVYAVFLVIQTMRHREFFSYEVLQEQTAEKPHGPLWVDVVLLLVSLVPVVVLAEELAVILDFGTHRMGLPPALAGLIVAGLILAPEGMGGIRAAASNHLQRSVNLLLGSALATIALTIPAVLIVGVVTGKSVVLGLPSSDTLLLAVVLALCVITFGRGRTNVLQGAIHLLVFLMWLALVFQG